jgi:CotH kinase protein
MIIHDTRRRGPGARAAWLAGWFRRARPQMAWLGLSVLTLPLLGGAAFMTVADPKATMTSWLLAHGYSWALNDRMRTEMVRLPFDWTQGMLRSPRVPILHLDISFDNMLRLREQHARALARGMLVQGVDDEVNARITIGSESVRASVRLKGDTPLHFEGGRRSFRIEVKGADAVLGMRSFSLQHPITRDYHTEPLFLESIRQHGLLAPRYRFVDVYVNGDFEGRLALEEHFSKELLESQGRRESVILRFDESDYWRLREEGMPWELALDHDLVRIDAFQDGKVTESPILSQHRDNGIRLLDGMRRGLIAPSEVFEATAMGRFIALSEAWSAVHGLEWRNLRFYYNPVTTRLEPIAYDGKVLFGNQPAERIVDNRAAFTRLLLADSVIRQVHDAMLQDLASAPGEYALMDSLEVQQAFLISVLRRHYPLVRRLPLEAVAERARGILARQEAGETDPFGHWQPTDLLWARYVRPEGTGSQAYVELASRTLDPLTIVGLSWRALDGSLHAAVSDRSTLPVHVPAMKAVDATRPWASRTSLLPAPLHRPAERVRLRLDQLPSDSTDVLVVMARRTAGREFALIAEPGLPPLQAPLLPAPLVSQVLEDHPYLSLQAGGVLRVTSGTWHIAHPLTIPDGHILKIGPGTTLRFGADAGILSHGALYLEGTREAPIVLMAADAQLGWPGIMVLPVAQQSRWQHVTIDGTRGFASSGWSLTSGVTFYESPVDFRNVRFAGNRTEDALNLIRSPFELRDVSFVDAQSDALDLDYSDGHLERVRFENIGWIGGGDALDLSGSRVTLKGGVFARIGDKAISVGEQAQLTASEIEVREAGAGAVTKDGSTLYLRDARLEGVRAGLMTYRKKPEYGQPSVEAVDVVLVDAAEDAVAQTGSVLRLNGAQVATRAVDVEALYSTVMRKGGASR